LEVSSFQKVAMWDLPSKTANNFLFASNPEEYKPIYLKIISAEMHFHY